MNLGNILVRIKFLFTLLLAVGLPRDEEPRGKLVILPAVRPDDRQIHIRPLALSDFI
jgi:hypothetical protein